MQSNVLGIAAASVRSIANLHHVAPQFLAQHQSASRAGSDLRLAAVSLSAGNFAGIVCEPTGGRAIRFLFYPIAATACGNLAAHDGQGNRIVWQGAFCGRQGTSQGFLHTLFRRG
jgi:hypothetical protein